MGLKVVRSQQDRNTAIHSRFISYHSPIDALNYLAVRFILGFGL
jgi:hypothetical protein